MDQMWNIYLRTLKILDEQKIPSINKDNSMTDIKERRKTLNYFWGIYFMQNIRFETPFCFFHCENAHENTLKSIGAMLLLSVWSHYSDDMAVLWSGIIGNLLKQTSTLSIYIWSL